MRYYRHNAAPLVTSFDGDSLRLTLIEPVGDCQFKSFYVKDNKEVAKRIEQMYPEGALK